MKKLIKAVLAVIFCVALAFSVGGCTKMSGTTIGCVSGQTATSVSMTYHYFDGNKTYYLDFKEGDKIAVESTTTEGTLKMTITLKDGEEIYSGNLTDFPEFTVNINEDGTYLVKFVAQKHRGSFNLNW